MKKYIVIVGIVIGLFLIGVGLYTWYDDKLYLRMHGAKIWVNGIETANGALYKSSRGNYFLVIHRETLNEAYFILPSGGIGIPTEPVPSIITLSALTPIFFYEGQTEFRVAGRDYFTPDATSFVTEDEISFKIHEETVRVIF
jgi:hypothetical protein